MCESENEAGLSLKREMIKNAKRKSDSRTRKTRNIKGESKEAV